MTSKYQGGGIPPELKSQIMSEILSPNAVISAIAKKHGVSSTTLYTWRKDYNEQSSNNKFPNNNQTITKTNFIELVSDESSGNISVPTFPNSRLSEISLKFNNDVSLSINGNISAVVLTKIINSLPIFVTYPVFPL